MSGAGAVRISLNRWAIGGAGCSWAGAAGQDALEEWASGELAALASLGRIALMDRRSTTCAKL